jgi:hypothetical protein
MNNKENQYRDEDINRHNSIIIVRKRYRHSNYNRINKRNNNSLFGVFNENYDGDDTVKIRNANR